MRHDLQTRSTACAIAASSSFSKSRDADATPSTSSHSPRWVTLLRSSFRHLVGAFGDAIDHCKLAIRAVPQRTSSTSVMVSGSNRLSVSSDSAALPCHSRERASGSLASRPPPR